MADSNYVRTGTNPSGALRKGRPAIDPNARSAIPSRYVTKLHREPKENPGFGQSAPRFSSSTVVEEIPGPGTYDSKSSVNIVSNSHSKQGLNGFASKTKRFQSQQELKLYISQKNPVPGPHDYQYDVNQVSSRKDFRKHNNSSVFAPSLKDSIVRQPDGEVLMPGPGTYDVPVAVSTNVGYGSSFHSQSKRTFDKIVHDADYAPAPGQYSPQDLPKSKSKSSVKDWGGTERPELYPANPNPGPGEYTGGSEKVDNWKTSPIIPPSKSRATRYILERKPKEPGPGPGSYTIPASKDAPVVTSAFRSSTAKGATISDTSPPVGQYDLTGTELKESFHFNRQGIWV